MWSTGTQGDTQMMALGSQKKEEVKEWKSTQSKSSERVVWSSEGGVGLGYLWREQKTQHKLSDIRIRLPDKGGKEDCIFDKQALGECLLMGEMLISRRLKQLVRNAH